MATSEAQPVDGPPKAAVAEPVDGPPKAAVAEPVDGPPKAAVAEPLDILVLYEHPEWQKPLFAALERRGSRYDALDLKRGRVRRGEPPAARVYFNQASPSAYVRGNTRAVPLALSY